MNIIRKAGLPSLLAPCFAASFAAACVPPFDAAAAASGAAGLAELAPAALSAGGVLGLSDMVLTSCGKREYCV